MKIGITSDHRGYHLKQNLIGYLQKKKYEVVDYGCESVLSVDYPDYALLLSSAVMREEVDFGIAICGSGIGISIACNKVKGIRCAKVDNAKEAELSKNDNNCNIIALNGTMPSYKAKDIIDSYLKSAFSNEERHLRRIEKMMQIEKMPKFKKETINDKS